MVKDDIVNKVSEQMNYTKDDAYNIIELVLETLKEAIVSEEFVKITGFGNFKVQHKTARKGRNPQTGEHITLAARKILTFKPSQVLKNSMNPDL